MKGEEVNRDRQLPTRIGHTHNACYKWLSGTSHSKMAIRDRFYAMFGRLNPRWTDIENLIVTGDEISSPTKARDLALLRNPWFSGPIKKALPELAEPYLSG